MPPAGSSPCRAAARLGAFIWLNCAAEGVEAEAMELAKDEDEKLDWRGPPALSINA